MRTLYYGGDIVTMEQENGTVEAVLTQDGRILKTGKLGELEAIAGGDTVRVDLEGRTMLPAFIDAHSHISVLAQMSAVCDLGGAESFDEIVGRLKSYMTSEAFHGDMLIGFGYDHNMLAEEAHPNRSVLDRVSGNVPIFILHASAHMGCANSAALKLCDIGAQTADPQGGKIGRGVDGEPDGYLEEAGMIPLQKKMAATLGAMDMAGLLEKAQTVYLQNGIATVQDGAANAENVRILFKMAQEGRLKLDVVSYPMLSGGGREVRRSYPQCDGQYFNRFKIGGYKLVLDGSPQGKSAWLTRPYENSGDYRGYPWLTDGEAEKYMRMAVDDDRQLLVHCNGDAAADQYLKYYERAYRESQNPNKGALRPVMIHCQTVRDDQLDRMVPLHMIPSIFVAHTYYWGDVHLKNLGPKRGAAISPAKSALDRGLILNFHQDAPVVKPLMLHTVWCAVNRKTRKGADIGPGQRISVYDALRAVTVNAAYAYYEEDQKGSIREGKRADFVILDKNPLKTAKEDIRDIRVLETIREDVSLWRA